MKGVRLEKIMVVLSAMGALLSMYLLYTTLSRNYFCPTDGCSIVGSSPYSYFLGIPVALWGLGYYGVLMVLLTKIMEGSKVDLLMRVLGILLLIGVIFTLYLRYLEFFVIGAICFWCWFSVVFVAGLIICYFFLLKRK